MYLIPSPKHCIQKEGTFQIKRNTKIVLSGCCNFEDLNAALLLQEEVEKQLGFKLPIHKTMGHDGNKQTIQLKKGNQGHEAYDLIIDPEGIQIIGGSSTGLFYGVQTLRQMVRQVGSCQAHCEIKDEPHFKFRGFYHDVTRGKVPTLETLKELVDRAAFYKINQLQLYVEHTFAFEGMSEVWMDKDPLTAEEILLLDAYCKQKHIELVPSLSTFGHLYEVLRTKSFEHLCELEGKSDEPYSFVARMAHHTLDATDKESIALVRKMLEQFIPLFSSSQFNICCDETFDLGKGKSKAKGEEIGVGKLYIQFLNQVISIVKSYDKKVMFWGDIILHHPELLSEIPQDVVCLTWDYTSNAGDGGIATIAATGKDQYVCPGVGGWSMLMNLMGNAFSNIQRMVSHGVKHGAVGVLNTDWGDYGHVNLLGGSIPGMAYGGALSWNPEETKEFEEICQAISKVEYGDESQTLVSLLHRLSGNQTIGWYEIVRWKELGELPKRDAKALVKGYEIACEVESKLGQLAHQIKDHKEDVQEFLCAARAIQLVHALAMNFITKDQPEAVLIEEPHVLAGEFEQWFYEYEIIWRKRNKESELRRIREVVVYICKYLRSL